MESEMSKARLTAYWISAVSICLVCTASSASAQDDCASETQLLVGSSANTVTKRWDAKHEPVAVCRRITAEAFATFQVDHDDNYKNTFREAIMQMRDQERVYLRRLEAQYPGAMIIHNDIVTGGAFETRPQPIVNRTSNVQCRDKTDGRFYICQNVDYAGQIVEYDGIGDWSGSEVTADFSVQCKTDPNTCEVSCDFSSAVEASLRLQKEYTWCIEDLLGPDFEDLTGETLLTEDLMDDTSIYDPATDDTMMP